MKLLYQISIFSYTIAIHLASLFNEKAKFWVLGRKNIFQKIKSEIKTDETIVWFHCASLGEFEQGRPVIEAYKMKFPNEKILITFFSPSGYKLRRNYEKADYVFYLPIDTAKNAKRFIDIIKPKKAFFIKYEFWNFYLKELKKNNTPTYLISGIFRENQLFFKWYGKWYQQMLKSFTHFFVQNKTSLQLITNLGFNNVTLTGDTRFDRVFDNSLQTTKLPIIESFKNNQRIIIGGSSWPTEEQILADYFKSSSNPLKLIIAPHDVSENHIKKIEHLFHNNCIRYSKATEQNVRDEKVLIIDNIGILANTYQYSDIAFIGGGFTGALHNILEPCSFGNLILFGPQHHKFHEAQNLIENGGAFTVNNNNELENLVTKKMDQLTQIKSNNLQFVEDGKGAVDIIMNSI
ncbi:MAG: 3-deoxy-D-manno-octulosonic acid transferase [Flavobacteriales bacterium]|nr:3-deoxy-D-manno-octulosonic acid transferase [Flavobacteriales bacterium]